MKLEKTRTPTHPLRRRLGGLALALAAVWAATGCGGGGEDPTAAFAARLAQVVPATDGLARALAVNTNATATVGDLFAWAQWKWPTLFPANPVQVEKLIGTETFQLRVYASGIILAVGTTNRGVYALLPIPGADVVALGTIEAFATEITAATCSFNPTAPGCSGGGGTGSGSYNVCVDPAAQNLPTGFTTTIVYQYQGTLGGEQTVQSTIVGPGTFEGQSAVRINSTTTGTNTVSGITQTTTTENATYSRVAASGLTETLGSQIKATIGGGSFMGIPLPSTVTESKVVFNPAVNNAEFTLQIGQSLTKTSSSTTTVVSGAGAGTPPITASGSETHTYEARETITVLGKSYDTCRYRVTSAGSPAFTTTWFIVGKGVPARISSSGQDVFLKSGSYNGAAL